ncbi:choice-of-anchor I family protein [uncultured Meiothermus sp.]|jgi:DNA-binding beta-propeller fold protein YncE|uniref:choice-of-anchor I family protein n=1 Tax=uncultured Meiothermus sp. TaxID=157471 RepID=UPI002608FF77|nr:choice-of-anchor I family protein [uncultured Meiothermus sp.]
MKKLAFFTMLVGLVVLGQTQPAPVTTADFKVYNARKDQLVSAGVRIFGPSATVAQDLEPEYIAVSPDSRTAYVTLQENNALAVVDIRAGRVTEILPLGFKDHSRPGSGLDVNDRDNQAKIEPAKVFGMYQPDAIAHVEFGGQGFLITANEGDARAYPGFNEEARVGDLQLDPGRYTPEERTALARLQVTRTLGQSGAAYGALYAFGARSVSVWSTAGRLVWDSGDLKERTVLARNPQFFNTNHTANARDGRSAAKGPEPEGVAVGRIGGRQYAFVGLERQSAILSFDVTIPQAPVLRDYAINRNFAQAIDASNYVDNGDLGPEGLVFVPATDSPNGQPMLIVGNEVSGSTAFWQVEAEGRLKLLGRYVFTENGRPVFNRGAAEIPAFDPRTRRVFVVNGHTRGIDILEAANPAQPRLIRSVSFRERGVPNSVAVRDGLVAVALEAPVKTDPGSVVFMDTEGNVRASVPVGALPDMLTFTPDGRYILTANEGEPSDDYRTDPEGSISIIELARVPGLR